MSLYFRVTLKDMKTFLRRVNCKIPTGKLREFFNEVDTRNSAQLGFDEFSSLFHKLMFDEKVPVILSFKWIFAGFFPLLSLIISFIKFLSP